MGKRLPKDAESLLAEMDRLRKLADRHTEEIRWREKNKTKFYDKIARIKRALYAIGWKG